MSPQNGDEASGSFRRSSSPSEDSIAPTVSIHDHEIHEKDDVPEILSEPIRPMVSRGAVSVGTTGTNDPDFEVDWEDDDPMDPINWPTWYKALTIGFISWSTWVVVVYSTSYTTGLAQMGEDFHISSEPIVTLGVTSYREC